MYNTKTLLPFLYLLVLLLSTCNPNTSDDEGEDPITTFDNGFFIVNQGREGNEDGSISYYDRGRKEVANLIFESKNENGLEGTLESMNRIDGRVFIVQNEEGTITMAEKSDMIKLGIISGFQNPRYFNRINSEKAYVSQWGSDGTSGSIQIVDLNTYSISGEIDSRPGPDRMLRVGTDFLYVTQTGGFVLDSVISKIDLNSNQILSTILVGPSPQSMQVDKDGALWVLAKGFESFTESVPGKLVKIVDDQVQWSIEVPLGSRDLVINQSRDQLYYINGLNQKIFVQDISSSQLALVPYSDRPVTSLGIDPVSNLPVGLDARNFQSKGLLLFFDSEGNVSGEFDLEFVPGYILF